MQGFLISGDVEREIAQAHFLVCHCAQADVDLNPDDFKEMVLEHSVPKGFLSAVKNPAALGIPRHIVFRTIPRPHMRDPGAGWTARITSTTWRPGMRSRLTKTP